MEVEGKSSPPVTLRCWGTRGSIPSPGPHTVRYGGNTSCLEILTSGDRIILDAGTGIRLLGDDLPGNDRSNRVSIFLTHFHWDHIQGLPFFGPANRRGCEVGVHGPKQDGMGMEELLTTLFSPAHFPLSIQNLSGQVTVSEVDEGSWSHGEFGVKAMRVRHHSNTLGYRIETSGKTMVFIPDNELEGGSLPTPPGWRSRLSEFVSGADILFHDAMFTEAEGDSYRGWGHSMYEDVVELALESEVKRLSFFHHSPGRSDDELDRLVDVYARVAMARGSDMMVEAASERIDIRL